MNSIRNQYKQRGATLVELIYVLPLFFILLFGIVELAYVYRSKATLNVATFEAARSGALNNARRSEMRDALAGGMTPLFVGGSRTAGAVIGGYGKAKLFETSINTAAVGDVDTVEIVSPNRRTFDAFKQRIPVLDEDSQRVTYVDAIPNDNLTFRSTATKNVRIGSRTEKINIQDANLLKIKTLWCHKLKVPGLRELVYRTILDGFFGFGPSPEQRSCNAVGLITGEVYVAITSQAITRMQTPVYRNDLEN